MDHGCESKKLPFRTSARGTNSNTQTLAGESKFTGLQGTGSPRSLPLLTAHITISFLARCDQANSSKNQSKAINCFCNIQEQPLFGRNKTLIRWERMHWAGVRLLCSLASNF